MHSNNPDYNKNDPKGWGGDPSRGAAMGRFSICNMHDDFNGTITIREVCIDDDGYDPNGTYFGLGEPLWWCSAQTNSRELDEVHRSETPEKMMDILRKRFPDADIVHSMQGIQPGIDLNKIISTEIAKVAINREANGRGEPPLMLTQQIGAGNADGRKFTVSLCLGSGSLVISFESTSTDAARAYTVSPYDIVEAILAAEPEISK